MELILLSMNKRVKKSVENDFYWFNPIDKLMYHGKGSRMEFVYNKEHKISFPKIVKEELWTNELSFNAIIDWASENRENFGIDVMKNGSTHQPFIARSKMKV